MHISDITVNIQYSIIDKIQTQKPKRKSIPNGFSNTMNHFISNSWSKKPTIKIQSLNGDDDDDDNDDNTM